MIKFHKEGKSLYKVGEKYLRCSILPDPVISPHIPKPDIPTTAREPSERSEWLGPSFPGISVLEDNGTCMSQKPIKPLGTVRCEHGLFYVRYECLECKPEKASKPEKAFKATPEKQIVRGPTRRKVRTIDEDIIFRLKKRIADRTKHDPDFCDQDVLAYEAAILKKYASGEALKPRIHRAA